MGDDDDGTAFVRPAGDLIPEVDVRSVIEALIWLIEEENLRVVEQREGQVQFLALASGEVLCDGRVCVVEAKHVEHVEGTPARCIGVGGTRRQKREVFLGVEQVDEAGLLRAPPE